MSENVHLEIASQGRIKKSGLDGGGGGINNILANFSLFFVCLFSNSEYANVACCYIKMDKAS